MVKGEKARSDGSRRRSTNLQRVSTQLRLHHPTQQLKRVTTGNSVLDHLPYAVDAPFNLYAKQNSTSCLPNTRIDLLREVHGWANRQDERSIFWLNGLAG